MKRGTDRKVKFLLLQHRLKIPAWQVKGLLQSLWDFASENAIDGAVGRFTNLEIAMGMGLDAKMSEPVIAALVAERWLDQDAKFRLVIHDWHDHCEDWIRKKVQRSGGQFASLTTRDPVPIPADTFGRTVENVPPASESVGCQSSTGGLPLPSLAIAQPSLAAGSGRRPPGLSIADAESIYDAYPKHADRSDAIRAIQKYVPLIAASRAVQLDEAIQWTLSRVRRYALSPYVKTTDKQYIPACAVWFNKGKYDDDEAEWNREHVGTNGRAPTPAYPKSPEGAQ